MHRWGLVLLVGCGRLGFDSPGGALGVDAPRDAGVDGDRPTNDAMIDAMIDATIDAPPNLMTFTFGEAPLTMFNTVTSDTYVSSDGTEDLLNYGADDGVRIEADAGERALIHFNISAIPTTATVVSASLAINCTQLPSTPLPIELHRVLEAWDEGNQSGTIGVANYVNRTGSLPWQNPGAGPPLSSTATFGMFTPVLGMQSFELPPAMLQAWVANSGTNFGIVMISTSNDSSRFTSSEGTQSTARPVLTVTFTP